MKMPKKLKAAWVKALRSGEYGQVAGTLCDGKGGFCCLGVLEHVAMEGEVEMLPDGGYRGMPTDEFYKYAGIEIVPRDAAGHTVVGDLIDLNDKINYDTGGNKYGPYYVTGRNKYGFKAIANYIEKHVETF